MTLQYTSIDYKKQKHQQPQDYSINIINHNVKNKISTLPTRLKRIPLITTSKILIKKPWQKISNDVLTYHRITDRIRIIYLQYSRTVQSKLCKPSKAQPKCINRIDEAEICSSDQTRLQMVRKLPDFKWSNKLSSANQIGICLTPSLNPWMWKLVNALIPEGITLDLDDNSI